MSRESEIYRTTVAGTVGNLMLLLFKLFAGIVGHSAAMIADAVHSASDFVTDIIVIAFVRISGKPRDVDHQYGHGKYETLATAVIGLMLMGVGAGIFWHGITEIVRVVRGGEIEAPGMLAFIAAIASIMVKEGLYQYTIRVGRRLKSQAVMANAWHHRSDAFSSIATAIGIGGALLLGEGWRVLDPIAAVIVSVLIVKVSLTLFVPSINELLEKSLPMEVEERILEAVKRFPEVEEPHNIRTRRIGPISAVEMHIRVDGNLTVNVSHEITRGIEAMIREILGPETLITIHVEPRRRGSEE